MKGKKRVLIDTFHLFNALTGIRTYTTQLCQGLEKMNSDKFEYIYWPNWRKLDQSKFLKGKLSFQKKLLNHASFLIWKQIVLPIYILINRIDFVLYPDFVAPYFTFGSTSLIVIHDTFFWDFKNNYPALWRNYFTTMIQLGIKQNSVIVATSYYTKENIERVFALPNPIEILYQAPKLPIKLNEDLSILDKYGLDVKYFLHVGLFDKRKNIQILVKSFDTFLKSQQNQNYKLVLVGEKGLSYRNDDYAQVVQLITTLNIEDKVILTGFISNEQLNALYGRAFAYLFPSLDEGFGIPVLESYYHKIPLIISDRGSLKEIAGEGALVFEGENSTDLAEKLSMITDEGIRKQLIIKGNARVKEFTQAKFASTFESIVLKYNFPK